MRHPVAAILATALSAAALSACGGSSNSSTSTPPAARPATSTPTPASASPGVPAGVAKQVKGLQNSRLASVARQCKSTSHSQAEAVSCLQAHGIQVSSNSAQANVDACINRVGVTHAGECVKYGH